MIYEKTLLNTLLKYDTDTEKLYRFNKQQKRWTLIDPTVKYDKTNNAYVYCSITIDKKYFSIYRLIYYVCHSSLQFELSYRYIFQSDN